MPQIHFNGKTYNDLAEMPATERDRITSYNVCYTKLLRYIPELETAVQENRPVFTDLYRHTDVVPESIHISVVVPVYTDQDQSGQPMAALLLDADAAKLLYPLLDSWPSYNFV